MLTRIGRLLVLVAGVCACSITFSGEPTMTNPLLSKPRPWCIGRFVFDRPVASKITNQRYAFWGNKLETQHNASPGEYQAKVDAAEKNTALKDDLILQIQEVNRALSGLRKHFLRQRLQRFSLIKRESQRLRNCPLIRMVIFTKTTPCSIQLGHLAQVAWTSSSLCILTSIVASRHAITGRSQPKRDSASTAESPRGRQPTPRRSASRLH